MNRVFIAFALPQMALDQLLGVMEGVYGARWQAEEQLHLTLRFIGKADRHQLEDAISAISELDFAPIGVRLAGVGHFGHNRAGGAIWAGLAPTTELSALNRRIDNVLVRTGFAPDPRAYLPHITVGRLPRGSGPVTDWLCANTNLKSPDFLLDTLTLFNSFTSHSGSRYEPLASWRADRKVD